MKKWTWDVLGVKHHVYPFIFHLPFCFFGFFFLLSYNFSGLREDLNSWKKKFIPSTSVQTRKTKQKQSKH